MSGNEPYPPTGPDDTFTPVPSFLNIVEDPHSPEGHTGTRPSYVPPPGSFSGAPPPLMFDAPFLGSTPVIAGLVPVSAGGASQGSNPTETATPPPAVTAETQVVRHVVVLPHSHSQGDLLSPQAPAPLSPTTHVPPRRAISQRIKSHRAEGAALSMNQHFWKIIKTKNDHIRAHNVPFDAFKEDLERSMLLPQSDTMVLEEDTESHTAPDEDVHVRIPYLGHNETSWYDIKSASHLQITDIAAIIKLNPLTLEDLMTGYTPEKLESVEDYFFCVLTFSKDDVAVRIAIVLTDRMVFTIHQDSSWIVTEAISRLQVMKLTTMTSEAIFYAVLDTVTDIVVCQVHAFQSQVDAVDEDVFSVVDSNRSEMLRKITQTRKKIGSMKSVVASKEAIVRTVLAPHHRKCFIMRQNYQDVMDNINQALSRVDMMKDTISQANNNMMSVLSMQSADETNNTNKVMKRLTIFGGVMIPFNFIAGLFGMNVQVPFQNDLFGNDNTTAFWCIVGSCIGTLFLTVFIWRVKKYFHARRLAQEALEKKLSSTLTTPKVKITP
eukprot:PhF_6_TR42770/c0_g1_i1/m.64689/K16073/ALR, MNR; magnesium transporter